MSYFSSPVLTEGDVWVVNIDGTWISSQSQGWAEWAVGSGPGYVDVDVSIDEGQHWLLAVTGINSLGGSTPDVFTLGVVFNALRFTMRPGTTGTTCTIQVIGK